MCMNMYMCKNIYVYVIYHMNFIYERVFYVYEYMVYLIFTYIHT